MIVNKDKQYRTRDGREVRIYATDGGYPCTVHGAVFIDGKWMVVWWREDGTSQTDPNLNLVEVKPRIQREEWVNVFPNRSVGYPTKELADRFITGDAIARIKRTIDCEEGEGL